VYGDAGNFDDELMAAGFGKYGKVDEELKKLSQQIDFAGFCFSCRVSQHGLDSQGFKQECLKMGKMNACYGGNSGCASKIRKRDGKLVSLEMGCSGKQACENSEKENFRGRSFQCRPKATGGESFCSSCCDSTQKKNCNLEFVNNSKWDPTYLDYRKRA